MVNYFDGSVHYMGLRPSISILMCPKPVYFAINDLVHYCDLYDLVYFVDWITFHLSWMNPSIIGTNFLSCSDESIPSVYLLITHPSWMNPSDLRT